MDSVHHSLNRRQSCHRHAIDKSLRPKPCAEYHDARQINHTHYNPCKQQKFPDDLHSTPSLSTKKRRPEHTGRRLLKSRLLHRGSVTFRVLLTEFPIQHIRRGKLEDLVVLYVFLFAAKLYRMTTMQLRVKRAKARQRQPIADTHDILDLFDHGLVHFPYRKKLTAAAGSHLIDCMLRLKPSRNSLQEFILIYFVRFIHIFITPYLPKI